MHTHLEAATQSLFGRDAFRAADVKLFPGSSREIAPEQMAEQVKKALAQIESGDYDVVDDSED